MDQGADALLQAAHAAASLDDELSVVDEDGSSSLSEIEDKDADQDDDGEGSDELSNMSDEENDSEAETERIEESPNKFRAQKDVVLGPRNDDHSYERTPSKLHKHFTADDDDDDDEPLSDADVSMDESPESPKSSAHEDVEPEHTTGPTSLEDSSVENKNLLSAVESDTRKRKRSIMAPEEELGEPVRKRTGSVMTPGDDYAIEEDAPQEEDPDALIPISGNISGEEGGVTHEDEVVEEAEEHAIIDEEVVETVDIPISPKKRGRKKKKGVENGVNNHVEDSENPPDPDTAINGDDARQAEEDNAENEGDDEAEAAQKNEEERKFCCSDYKAQLTKAVEKKRIALDQLTSIERQFSTFRDR